MIDFEIRISVPEPFKLMENNEMKSTRRLNIGAYKTTEVRTNNNFFLNIDYKVLQDFVAE